MSYLERGVKLSEVVTEIDREVVTARVHADSGSLTGAWLYLLP